MKMLPPDRYRCMMLVLTLAGAGQAAWADTDEISYTYVSLEYEYSNVYDGSHGVTFGFCFEVADPFHVFGGWQEADLDIFQGPIPDIGGLMGRVEADRQNYLVGVGYKQRIGKGKTMQYRAGYINSETTIRTAAPGFPHPIPPTVVADDGYYLEVGVRTLPWPGWELDGFVAKFSVGEFDSSMLFITLERRVTENLGINLSFKNVEGDNTSEDWILALRYHL